MTPSGSHGSAPRLYSIASAANDVLGGISVRSVWKLIEEHDLPVVKLGARTLLREDHLRDLIEARTKVRP